MSEQQSESGSSAFFMRSDGPPLRLDDGGVVRVGKSRIQLDLVVEQYANGMTPEDIVRAYDELELADVYATIGYYLRHRDEVQLYLKQRAGEAAAWKSKIVAERPRITRSDLTARVNARETDHAASGQ